MKNSFLVFKLLSLMALASIATQPVQALTLAAHAEQNYSAVPLGAGLKGGNDQTSLMSAESFPQSYEGYWQCETLVTDSSVPSVIPGEKVVCNVRFMRDSKGNVVSIWEQDGWVEGQSSVNALNDIEARMDRTSYYTAPESDGTWAARAQGSFRQINGSAIVASSVVDQYGDGRYLGRYHTTSLLCRANPWNGVASANSEPRNFTDDSGK